MYIHASCIPKYEHWKELWGEDAFKFIKFGFAFSYIKMNELHSNGELQHFLISWSLLLFFLKQPYKFVRKQKYF